MEADLTAISVFVSLITQQPWSEHKTMKRFFGFVTVGVNELMLINDAFFDPEKQISLVAPQRITQQQTLYQPQKLTAD